MASKRTVPARPQRGNASRNRAALQRQRRRRWAVAASLIAGLAALVAVIAVAVGGGGSSTGTSATRTASVVRVAPTAGYDLLRTHQNDPAFVTLDVRTPAEYANGHLPQATNLDFYAADFRSRLGGLDKTKTYLVYCHSGNRSGQATAAMHDLGFQHVYDVQGGIAAWEQAGLPIIG